ncbi:MAG: hypothetical protein AAF447_10995 [Myxococcota bacterium]
MSALLLRLFRAAPALFLFLAACGGGGRTTTGGMSDIGLDAMGDAAVDMPEEDEGVDMPVDEGPGDKEIDPAQFGTDIDDEICPDMDPQGDLPLLMITQVRISENVSRDPNAGVEVFNPRAEPLDLSETPIWLESRPSDVELSTISGGDPVIGPGEYRFYRFGAEFDVVIGRQNLLEAFEGELTLNTSGTMFGTRPPMIDFVCWGDTPDPEESRIGAAIQPGPDGSGPLWVGPCAPELDEENLSLRRRYGREGSCGNDYESAQAFVTRDCSAE